MSGIGAAPDDAVVLTPERLLAAFRQGEVVGPKGPLVPSAARLTARSLLLMTPGSVLKLRRPRRVAGQDMTTRTLRAWGTEQELWIGRRVAPTTYLGDACLRFDGERYELVPTLLTAEPVVAMTRLPEDVRADVLAPDAPDASVLRPVLDRIAAFHEASPVHRAHDGWGAPGRMRDRWREILGHLPAEGPDAPLSPAARDHLAAETEAWLDALDGDLVHRVTEGRIRHLHGELRLEHLYLADPVGIIDPAEEGDARHWSDTAEDIAALTLELRALGRADLAQECLTVYGGLTYDRTLPHVAPFFERLVAARRAVDELALAPHVPDDERAACVARARFFAGLAAGGSGA
ncbi:MAG: hypothetical protein EP329_09155 [Deltaproteobacteria bacterium]|nr:MAG: hypothetical protein EP329_09155 [Deltaproteobacteria bacterium]